MKTFLFIVFIFCTLIGNAQSNDRPVLLTHYVFNEFTPGIVKLKTGAVTAQLLNYNIITNEMIFNNNGKYMAISDSDGVDTIIINERKFVPVNKKFYEVLVESKLPLLEEFTAKIMTRGALMGYGQNSDVSAVTSYKSLLSNGHSYELVLPSGFTVKPGYIFWILKDGQFEKISSSKQIIKTFPEKKDLINETIKKNDLKLSKREDIIMLIRFIEL
ncbi:MAG: hypothetical protein ABI683_06405 [Ginsengibacter sp.]